MIVPSLSSSDPPNRVHGSSVRAYCREHSRESATYMDAQDARRQCRERILSEAHGFVGALHWSRYTLPIGSGRAAYSFRSVRCGRHVYKLLHHEG